MLTLEAIRSRRSVKHFDASHKMTDQEISEIISLAMLSPTAFNLQNWRFVIAEDAALREQIKQAAMGQAQVTDASLLLILCADLKAWEKDTQRYWRHAAQEVQDFMLPAMDGYYRNKDQVQRDETMRSCGIAAQTIMLAAKSLGYESCPMDGFNFDEVAKLINLPDDHVITMFVAIGKGTKEAWPRPGQLALDDVVIKNGF
jgi:nitroreductase|tara:strand:- start:203 stop:805 length:603 start_codon:yes stop_codon:yes gene_type:complete